MTRPRVLIAEDETLIRLDLQRLLDLAGFDVCGAARNGREAVSLALECTPDAVVLDVDMPELDGVEAARQILAARSVPIVMLTAFSYGELVSRALDAGVAGYVVKPFRETDLVEAIREALVQGPDEDALVYLRRAANPLPGNKHGAAGDLAVPKLGEDVVHGIQ